MDWNEYFYYDETSPSCLRWKIDIKCGFRSSYTMHYIGDVAGYLERNNYYTVMLKGSNHKVHRIVYELLVGPIGTLHIDHVNRVTSNNKIHNLRVVSITENNRNRSKQIRNKTGITGVTKWQSRSNRKWYYRVQWNDLNGKHCCKSFRIDLLGDEEALQLAAEWRNKMIQELNAQGAGYSSTHGK